MKSKPPYGLVIAALLLTQILFGINYAVAKLVVSIIPPLVWAALRAFITAGLLFLLAFTRPHPVGGSDFFKRVFFFSLIGVAINQACFLVGLSYTTSTNSAILNTLIPVFAIAFITILGKEKLTRSKMIGFVSALTGALIILGIEKLEFSSDTVYGDFLLIINAMSYGLYIALSKDFLERNDRIWVTFWQFFFGAFVLGTLAIPQLPHTHIPEFTPSLIAAMSFVVLGGSFFPYIFNNWALAHTEASRVALYVYIQPAVASAVSAIWFGEQLTARALVGCVLIFVGAYFATIRIRKSHTITIAPPPP